MPAKQFRRREIQQAALILVDQPSAFDADMPLLVEAKAEYAALK